MVIIHDVTIVRIFIVVDKKIIPAQFCLLNALDLLFKAISAFNTKDQSLSRFLSSAVLGKWDVSPHRSREARAFTGCLYWKDVFVFDYARRFNF